MVSEPEVSGHTETFDAKQPADPGLHRDCTEALEGTEVEAAEQRLQLPEDDSYELVEALEDPGGMEAGNLQLDRDWEGMDIHLPEGS